MRSDDEVALALGAAMRLKDNVAIVTGRERHRLGHRPHLRRKGACVAIADPNEGAGRVSQFGSG